jgi:hypothetical protein
MKRLFACLLITAISEGSLLTNGIATQSSDHGSNTANKAVDSFVNNMAHTLDNEKSSSWWDYEFSEATQIKSVFVLAREGYERRHVWDITVGDNTVPGDNTVCASVDASGLGGWYTCGA